MADYVMLIRHAESELQDGRKIFLGHTNPVLSSEGKRQALSLAQELKNCKLDSIFASDLLRAKETAETIAEERGLPVSLLPNFREINLGLWDGLTHEEVQALYPNEYRERGLDFLNFSPPGGENFADLSRRALPCLQEIFASVQGNAAVITHAGVIRIILAPILNIPIEQMFKIKIDYCSFHVLQQDKLGLKLEEDFFELFNQ